MLNRLLGEERVIVSPIPGTTRDAIDTDLIYHGQQITLIDTAGIRRRGRIEPGVEKYSVLRALKAIERADVVLLMIDASEGVTAQDTHIAGMVIDKHKSVVVLVNKWDLIEKDSYTMDTFSDQIRTALNFLAYVPVLFISAKTGQRVHQVLPTPSGSRRTLAPHPYRRDESALTESPFCPSTSLPQGKNAQYPLCISGANRSANISCFMSMTRSWCTSPMSAFSKTAFEMQYSFLGTPIRLSFRKRNRGEKLTSSAVRQPACYNQSLCTITPN